jgi:hypothetical protein
MQKEAHAVASQRGIFHRHRQLPIFQMSKPVRPQAHRVDDSLAVALVFKSRTNNPNLFGKWTPNLAQKIDQQELQMRSQ